MWERSSQRLLATLHSYLFSVDCLAFTPDGTRLAAANGDGSIKFWNLDTYQEVLTLKAHPTKSRLAFTPGSETMVSGSLDGVRYWHAPSLAEIEATEAEAKKKMGRDELFVNMKSKITTVFLASLATVCASLAGWWA